MHKQTEHVINHHIPASLHQYVHLQVLCNLQLLMDHQTSHNPENNWTISTFIFAILKKSPHAID